MLPFAWKLQGTWKLQFHLTSWIKSGALIDTRVVYIYIGSPAKFIDYFYLHWSGYRIQGSPFAGAIGLLTTKSVLYCEGSQNNLVLLILLGTSLGMKGAKYFAGYDLFFI